MPRQQQIRGQERGACDSKTEKQAKADKPASKTEKDNKVDSEAVDKRQTGQRTKNARQQQEY